MSSYQTLPAAGKDVQQHFLDTQASLFLFDLKNEAIEHGFKTGDSWSLQMVTEAEIKDLKAIHHPVVTLRLQPYALLGIFKQVKSKLKQTLTTDDDAITVGELTANEKRFLVAYRKAGIRS